MLCVISPAKKMDFSNAPILEELKAPSFEKQTKLLIKELQLLSPKNFEEMMKISQNLADLNFKRFQNFQFPINEKNSRAAAFVFQGDTYKGLEFESFSKQEQNYSQKTLRILSGLYGLLSPLDLIQEYRLEMGTKFSANGSKNLYEFWQKLVTEKLNTDLKTHKALVNLASNEYFECINTKELIRPVITPIFKENKNGVLKIISFNAKRARGMMAKYIIQNKLTQPEELESFELDNYKFNKKLSSDLSLVFTR